MAVGSYVEDPFRDSNTLSDVNEEDMVDSGWDETALDEVAPMNDAVASALERFPRKIGMKIEPVNSVFPLQCSTTTSSATS
jgi:hypothetical protein